MLAISRFDATSTKGSNQSGQTYAWGKNSRGQLGIGNKETQYSPAMIKNAKERFRKVECGQSFSIGISNTNRIYFWGNFKYLCNLKVTKDVDEPVVMSELESSEVHDIAACYKYIAVIIDKGEIRQWGKYLLDK